MIKVILAAMLTCVVGYVGFTKFGNPFSTPKNGWERKAALETPWRMHNLAEQSNRISNWPPRVGGSFPKVELLDHAGRPFDLKSLHGKPTVVEFVSMSCAGCQAFAGGKQFGAYGDLAVQPKLESFEHYLQQYAGVDLDSGDINLVIAVVYNDQLQSPTAEDLARWRNHFQLNRPNTYLVSSPELASGTTFKMIPGFMLLDDRQEVKFDSTGHHPQHNLYTELLPAIPKLLP